MANVAGIAGVKSTHSVLKVGEARVVVNQLDVEFGGSPLNRHLLPIWIFVGLLDATKNYSYP